MPLEGGIINRLHVGRIVGRWVTGKSRPKDLVSSVVRRWVFVLDEERCLAAIKCPWPSRDIGGEAERGLLGQCGTLSGGTAEEGVGPQQLVGFLHRRGGEQVQLLPVLNPARMGIGSGVRACLSALN